MVEFPTFEADNVNVRWQKQDWKNLNLLIFQYSVVYYEKDGDEIYQFRVQADLVTVPDNEILQVVEFVNKADLI